MNKLDILQGDGCFCFLNVMFDNLFTDDIKKVKDNLIEGVQEIIETKFEKNECHIVTGRDNIIAFLLFSPTSDIEQSMLGKNVQSLKNAIERFMAPFNITVSIGIGAIHCDRMGIIDAYNEASIAEERRFYEGKSNIYYFSSYDNEFKDEMIILPEAEKDIITSFTLGDLNKVDEILNMIYNNIAEHRKFEKVTVIDYFERIIDLLIEKITRFDNINREKLKNVCMIRNNLSNCNTLIDVRDMTISAINILTYIMFEIRNDGKINMVKVVNYIDQNILNKYLSLHEVAGYVHLSPKHFSVVFKQEMGVNFIEYITGVKIQKTKELLEQTDIKINDISKMLGFNDFKYFGRLFKKETGLTPTQFRRRIK